MTKKWLTATGVVVAIVIFFGVNIVGGRVLDSSRLDLTENNLFTLSDGTRNIVTTLEEPISLRFYLSQKIVTRIPQLNDYAKRVKSLLREYERNSDGKIDVRIIDPEPFSEEEERVVGYGLQGIPMSDSGETLYFGLVGSNSTDQQEVIPFFSDERSEMLEYDISQFVYRLSSAVQPSIGVISQLPIEGSPGAQIPGMPAMGPTGPWVIFEQLQEVFDVQILGTDFREIPDEVQVLLVVHPKILNDETLYTIDQFVMRGGRLIAFVDPNAEGDVPQPGMQVMGMSRASSLDRLTESWGVTLAEKSFAGDLGRAVKVRATPQFDNVVIDYPLWINLIESEINQEDPVSAKLNSLMLGSAGYFEQSDVEGIEVTRLFGTTPDAMKVGEDQIGPGIDPRELLRSYKPGGEALDIAIRVRGKAASAFPDGPPASESEADTASSEADTASSEADAASQSAEAGESSEADTTEGSGGDKAAGEVGADHLAESEEDINVILVADTDLLQDQFWVQIQEMLGSRIAVPSAANGAFVINAIDNMSGSSDLISIRNRPSFSRPFTLLRDYQKEAELNFRAKESELTEQLRTTEEKLRTLNEGNQANDQGLIFTPEQEQEVQNFRQERLRIRKELREVQRQLNKDIENVQTVTKAINIGLVPLAVAIFGLIVGLVRTRRRREKRELAIDAAEVAAN